jgi:hypothetical protein
LPGPYAQLHVDEVSQRLEAWLQAVADGADTSFVSSIGDVPDTGDDDKMHVVVCFRSIVAETPDRAVRHRDDAFLVNYLVQVRGTDALECQRAFSKIFFAAHEGGEFTLADTKNAPVATARDGGAQPAVMALTARLVRPDETGAPGIVLYPLDLHLRTLGHISGRVVTDSGEPVVRALVEARALDKRAVSDPQGRFVIRGAPAAGTVSLSVKVHDRTANISVDVDKQAEVLIVIPKEKEHA